MVEWTKALLVAGDAARFMRILRSGGIKNISGWRSAVCALYDLKHNPQLKGSRHFVVTDEKNFRQLLFLEVFPETTPCIILGDVVKKEDAVLFVDLANEPEVICQIILDHLTECFKPNQMVSA